MSVALRKRLVGGGERIGGFFWVDALRGDVVVVDAFAAVTETEYPRDRYDRDSGVK